MQSDNNRRKNKSGCYVWKPNFRAAQPNMSKKKYHKKRLLKRKLRRIKRVYARSYGVPVHISVYLHSKEHAKEVKMIRYPLAASTGFHVCPGCNRTFEREYQNYCDRCGQKLAWNDFSRGKITVVRRVSYSKHTSPSISLEKTETAMAATYS